MERYYLAVDIGASSGRHILGTVKDGIMLLEEIYRFTNGMEQKRGCLCWNTQKLFREIKLGMKRCADLGKIPESMGIDTWAVDFVLLDRHGGLVGDAVAYRDGRTKGMDEKVCEIISAEVLYKRTGIQKQIFNSIYQLMAVKEQNPEYLEQADSMLMIPDYFNYLLTGVKKQEYTNATTTQLVSPVTKTWDMELIEELGYPSRFFQPLSLPATVVGELTEEIEREVGFNCQVVLPATHDTGSAVMAVPSIERDILYISSGTWSLMGTECGEADCSIKGRTHNFTNEGGYEYRFRYLKNIMGLWMIQSVKRELAETYSFAQLCELASKAEISSMVDCNDACFLAPKSMIGAVQAYCLKTGQEVPKNAAELSKVIYHSLAVCYGNTVKELEEVTGKHYEKLFVVGGGADAEYLNELTARYSGLHVWAGPKEATAIGNLMAQMIKAGEFASLQEARVSVANSFEMKQY